SSVLIRTQRPPRHRWGSSVPSALQSTCVRHVLSPVPAPTIPPVASGRPSTMSSLQPAKTSANDKADTTPLGAPSLLRGFADPLSNERARERRNIRTPRHKESCRRVRLFLDRT